MFRAAKTQLRNVLINLKIQYLRFRGAKIHATARLSLKSNIDLTNPKGIEIREGAYVALNAIVLSHDFVRSLHTTTIIGKNCFVGAGSIILPGVVMGDNSISAAGSVVTKPVPPNSIVAGNPARVIRTGISTGLYGQLHDNSDT